MLIDNCCYFLIIARKLLTMKAVIFYTKETLNLGVYSGLKKIFIDAIKANSLKLNIAGVLCIEYTPGMDVYDILSYVASCPKRDKIVIVSALWGVEDADDVEKVIDDFIDKFQPDLIHKSFTNVTKLEDDSLEKGIESIVTSRTIANIIDMFSIFNFLSNVNVDYIKEKPHGCSPSYIIMAYDMELTNMTDLLTDMLKKSIKIFIESIYTGLRTYVFLLAKNEGYTFNKFSKETAVALSKTDINQEIYFLSNKPIDAPHIHLAKLVEHYYPNKKDQLKYNVKTIDYSTDIDVVENVWNIIKSY